jgi:hypothetical protein
MADAARAQKKAAAVLAKIAKMPAPFGEIGQRLHATILESAPGLEPTWKWGLPFYRKDGKDFCYFRPEGGRYMAFGFSGEAKLSRDAGARDELIACAWFFASMDEATQARIGQMVRQGYG